MGKLIYSGPKLFLERLEESVGSIPFNLINPDVISIESIKKSNNKEILIGRLDGAYYYDFTPRNFYNFLNQRSKPYHDKLKFLLKAPVFSSSFVNQSVNNYLNRASKWLINNSDGIVFQSQISKKMHQLFVGFEEHQCKNTIINNGVDLDQFSPIKAAIKLKGYPSIIISASRYRLGKRLHEAVNLVNFLSKVYPAIHLHVLGDVSEIIQKSLMNINNEKFSFHGKIKPSELPLYYSNADIMFSLMLFDACPNVVVEALASGLPVITPEESGAAELVLNNSWIVKEDAEFKYYESQTIEGIPKMNLEKYSEVVIHIMDNHQTYKDYARQRAIDELDINKVAKKYLNFYYSLKN
jgi:glycosyltransferase involved in cell wall biosynthesis